MPLIRDAGPGDIRAVLGVYSACIAADAGYLPFLEAGDEPAVLAWFLLKPLLACLVAEQGGQVVGIAGLRDADPGPGAGMPDGRWLEACRLAVHPAHRGGAVTQDLTSARLSRAVSLGADRLWMRCVENSPSHRLATAHGWTWWARTEFEGPAATQRAILLTRTLNDRFQHLRRRNPARSTVDAFEPQIRELLAVSLTMPTTVIAERVGWGRGLTVLKDPVRDRGRH